MIDEVYRPKVDFHVHYDPLDKKSPFSVIDQASAKKVVAIGLLARGEISPDYEEFVRYGAEKDVSVVPGLEYVASINGMSVDLVCLGFDYQSPDILKYFGRDEIRGRNSRLALIQKKFLESEGFTFDNLGDDDTILLNKLLAGETTEKAIHFCEIAATTNENEKVVNKYLLDRKEEYRVFENEYSNNETYVGSKRKLIGKFLYQEYFASGKKGFNYAVEKLGSFVRKASEVIDSVHSAGGVVLYSPEGNFSHENYTKLEALNIDGIMCWHGGGLGMNKGKPDVPVDILRKLIRSGKLILGGSDFQNKEWDLGEGEGDMYINPRRHEDLTNYIKARNKNNLPWVHK
jgi:hypothetical protein